MATKSNKQPLRTEKQFGDWKQHPIIIAATSFGAGLVFSWQFIIPIQTSRLEAKIELMSDDIKNTDKLKSKNKELEESFNKTNAAYQALITKNPFKPQGIYPAGFEDVKLGTPITLATKLPGADLSNFDTKGYFTIRRKMGLFRAVTVYKTGDRDEIQGFLYHADPIEPMLLVKHMEDARGPATFVDKLNDHHWKAGEYWLTVSPGMYATYTFAKHAPTWYKETEKKPETKR